MKSEETTLTRFIDPAPFVPGSKLDRDRRCEEILAIQSMGLKKRLEHTHCKNAVVGISGGLDSTLALLVTVRAFDLLGLERGQITAVTMPGFGTTDRTYENAVKLIRCLGAEFREIPIADAVRVHFRDIGQDETVHDVTYENATGERAYADLDGYCKYDKRRHGHRNRRYVRTGAWMGDLQRRSYVHVRGECLCTEDAGAPSGFLLCGMT